MSKARLAATFTTLTTSRVTVEVDIGSDGVGIENDQGDLFVDNVFDRHLVGNPVPSTTKWKFDDSTTTNAPGDYRFETIVRKRAVGNDTLSLAKPRGPKKGKGPAGRGKSKAAKKKKKKSR